MTTVTLRPATADDRAFIDSLSPRLSGVPRPAWHDLAAMEGFQDRHMAASFAPVGGRRDADRLRRGRAAAGLHPSAAGQGRRHRRALRLHLPARHDAGGRRHGRGDPADGRRRGLGARPRLSAAEPRRLRRQSPRRRFLSSAAASDRRPSAWSSRYSHSPRMAADDIAREALVDPRVDVRLHRADRARRRSIATGSTDRAGCASRPASAP